MTTSTPLLSFIGAMGQSNNDGYVCVYIYIYTHIIEGYDVHSYAMPYI